MKVATRFVLEPMRVEHIPAVAEIERLSFPQPWPRNAYRREIQENHLARYIVARQLDREPSGPRRLTTGQAEDGLFDRIARFLAGKPTGAASSPELDEELATIVGYAGLWLMVDEAHITTIASDPAVRGQGIGELLLLGMIDRALSLNARWLTLEVRLSNVVAQNLYRKYTFREVGTRRRYYSDNGEDALVMWTDALDSETFRDALRRNEGQLAERLGAELRLDSLPRGLADG